SARQMRARVCPHREASNRCSKRPTDAERRAERYFDNGRPGNRARSAHPPPKLGALSGVMEMQSLRINRGGPREGKGMFSSKRLDSQLYQTRRTTILY